MRWAVAGLDYGDKTIGIAVSDTLRQVATPLETIRRAPLPSCGRPASWPDAPPSM